MNVYLYQSWSEKELKNDYIWSAIPTSWLLWYRPLQSDLKDASWNGKDWNWYSGTGSFWAVGWKTGAVITSTNSTYPKSTQHVVTTLTYWNSPMTLMGWIYVSSYLTSTGWWWLICNSKNGSVWFQWILIRATILNNVWQSSWRYQTNTINTGQRYFLAATMNSNTLKVYVNWSLVGTQSWTFWWSPIWVFRLWTWMYQSEISGWQGDAQWYIRHCAVYNRVLTSDEILEFYNNTK